LGDGAATNRSSPVQIGTRTDWLSAFAGFYNSFAITTDGTLWAWGYNIRYKFGTVNSTIKSPIRMSETSDWSSGQMLKFTNNCISLKTDGTMWGWGANGSGILGLGDTVSRSSPTQIGSGNDWSTVRCGNVHTHAVKTGNSMWAWGTNNNTQLGLGDATNRSSPVQVGALTDWRLPIQASTSTLAIKTNNTLWAVGGANANGVLGLGDATARSSPVQVGGLNNWSTGSGGPTHVLAIKTDGTLWAWGLGANGRLGDGAATTRSSPVQIGTGTSWLSVSAGGAFSFAIRSVTVSSGTLWAWGYGSRGRLGTGDTTSRSSPVQVGTDTNWNSVSAGSAQTFATKSDGTLWAWGVGAFAALGLNEPNTSLGDRSSPVQIGTDTDWAFVNSHFYNTIGVKTDGRMFGWGRGYDQVLLTEVFFQRSSPVQVSSLAGWKQVSSYGSGIAIRR
jgi:alpha-tubulin suppressor-like RCC1 family protein